MVKIKITSNREIHVQSSIYKGKPVLDIRTFITPPEGMTPEEAKADGKFSGYTQKGINVPFSYAETIADAIRQVMKETKEKEK